MFAVQQPSTQTRQCPSLHQSDLAVSFATVQSTPVPYLTGVGQRVNADCSALNEAQTLKQCQAFLRDAEKLLCDLDTHFDNQFIEDFLSLSPSAMLEHREALLDTTMKKIADLSDVTDVDCELFAQLHSHISLFSLNIKQNKTEKNAFELTVTADESFFLYNVTEVDYPEFIREWLEQYIRFLAKQLGIETFSADLVEYELMYFLDMMEVNDDFSNAHIEICKKVQRKEELSTSEQTFVDSIYERIAEYAHYEETEQRVIDAIVELDEITHTDKQVPCSFDTIQAQFNQLIHQFAKSLCDSSSEVAKTIDIIQRQLNTLERINISETLPQDLTQIGDMPLAMNAVFDTERKIYNSIVDINEIGEQRMACGEYAELRVELHSPTALQALHRFIICEYFAFQLCQIELFTQDNKD